MAPVELTLVLAATRSMGIGRAGGLPWTGLKKEMAYFARVTKRLPKDVRSDVTFHFKWEGEGRGSGKGRREQ
jgi:hypothetical protein